MVAGWRRYNRGARRARPGEKLIMALSLRTESMPSTTDLNYIHTFVPAPPDLPDPLRSCCCTGPAETRTHFCLSEMIFGRALLSLDYGARFFRMACLHPSGVLPRLASVM